MKFLFWEITKRKPEGYVPPRNYQQKWVSMNGHEQEIKDMTDSHLRNSLGMIMNQLRQGKVAYIGDKDRIAFSARMDGLVDDKIAFVDAQSGTIKSASTTLQYIHGGIPWQTIQSIRPGDTINIVSPVGDTEIQVTP